MISAEAVLHEIAARLAGAAPAFEWTVRGNRVEHWLHVYDRARIITATEPAAGSVQLAIRDTGDDRARNVLFVIQTEEDLNRAWLEISRRAIWWAGRLTMWRLKPEHDYLVVRAFTDDRRSHFAAGDVLTFIRQDFARYDGYYVLTFRQATIIFDEDGQHLHDIDLYLEER